jgi:hypothetical protein
MSRKRRPRVPGTARRTRSLRPTAGPSERGRLTPDQEAWLDALRGVPSVEVYVWRPSDMGPNRRGPAMSGKPSASVNARPLAAVSRVALRWPDEVAEALGVSRSWLYDSGLAAELRFLRRGKVRLVLVAELERVLDRLSARWDD